MSINSKAVLMVGLPYDELVAYLGGDEVDRIVEEDELVTGSYFYDSSRNQNIIGYAVVETGQYTNIAKSDIREILTYLEEFEVAYGIEGQVYLTLSIT